MFHKNFQRELETVETGKLNVVTEDAKKQN